MSSVTQTDDTAAKTSTTLWALALVLLLGGWLSILHVYYWHFTAPVLFLWLGWAALLASARFLFRAGMAAAEDTGDVDDDFWRPVGRRQELLLEKRSLLKAIKEIEFDREMGKMSESDAADLTRLYRQRAIEIIKALESEGEADDTLSVQEQIEREVKARLVVAGAGAKGKARAARDEAADQKPAGQKKGQKNEKKNAKKGGQKADQKADQKAEKQGGQKAQEAAEKPAEKATAASRQPDTTAGEPATSEQAEPEVRAAAEDAS